MPTVLETYICIEWGDISLPPINLHNAPVVIINRDSEVNDQLNEGVSHEVEKS